MNASFIQTVSSLLAEAFVNTPPPPAFKKVFPLPEWKQSTGVLCDMESSQKTPLASWQDYLISESVQVED